MKHVIEGFFVLFVLILHLFLAAEVFGVTAKAAEAKEYKAAVVAELENSNFNPNVITACIKTAKEQGYDLQIEVCEYEEEEGRQIAEVLLTYDYEMPLLGVAGQKVTRGIAR